MRIEQLTSPHPESPPILVVDDDAAVLRLIEAWLSARGYRVRSANDAFQAIDALRDGTVGAMICDIQMPLYDGNWLIEEVAAARPDLPIIVMTGFDEVDPHVVRLPSVVGCLQKPLNRETLGKALEYAKTHAARKTPTSNPSGGISVSMM